MDRGTGPGPAAFGTAGGHWYVLPSVLMGIPPGMGHAHLYVAQSTSAMVPPGYLAAQLKDARPGLPVPSVRVKGPSPARADDARNDRKNEPSWRTGQWSAARSA